MTNLSLAEETLDAIQHLGNHFCHFNDENRLLMTGSRITNIYMKTVLIKISLLAKFSAILLLLSTSEGVKKHVFD